jgi:outer membrane protein assembly factor BamB
MPWVVTTSMPDTIVFTRDSTVHSVSFNGTTFTANWVATLTGTPTVSAPVDDGAGHIYVGGSDGKIHQIDLTTGTDQKQLPSAAISGTIGDPTFNPDLNTVIVGGSDGHIYTFATPF